MTASQDQQRMQLLPLVARHARDNRKVIHPHGTYAVTIIPVLPSDTIAYLLARLDEAESPAILAFTEENVAKFVRLVPLDLGEPL